MVPLTSPGESRIPKALLPVANKPLIEYVLEWCDQAPFKTVSVICNMKNEKAIKEVVEKYDSSRDNELRNSSQIKFLTSELKNTGEILHEMFPAADGNNENYVILPCDFITDVPPQVFVEVYRRNSDENIGLSIFYNNNFETVDKKLLKNNYTVYSDQDNGNMVLLDMYSKDFVTLDKFLKIRTQLLWRYPSTSISTKLLDSFIFFMNYRCRKVGNDKDVEIKRDINKIKRDLARNSWKHSISKPTIGMFALPQNASFSRINNLGVYMEINRQYLKEHARNNTGSNHNTKDKSSANIGVDCLVGDNCEIGERTTVKRTVIGENVKIGKKCRVSGCIILDGVVIDDEIQLENCIIGRNAKIETKSRLVNCNIEGSYTVGKNINLKGETLQNIKLDELNDAGDVFYDETSDDASDDESATDSDQYDDEGFEEEEYEDDIFSR